MLSKTGETTASWVYCRAAYSRHIYTYITLSKDELNKDSACTFGVDNELSHYFPIKYLMTKQCLAIIRHNTGYKIKIILSKFLWLLMISDTFSPVKTYYYNGGRIIAGYGGTSRVIILRPKQNGRHFACDIFRFIFFYKKLHVYSNFTKICPKGCN